MPLQKTTPEEIIRKSIQVFHTKGYYRTTMSDLAKATNLTKGAFYHHFANKEEVMKKSLEATSDWFKENIFIIAYDKTLSPKKRLSKISDILYYAFTKHDGGCFFANTILETAHVEDTFLEELNTFFDDFEKAIRTIFKEKYSRRELKAITQEVVANIEGTIILMQLKKDKKILKAAFNRIIKRL